MTPEHIYIAIGAALFARGGALYAGLRWNAEADRKARRDAFHAYWRKR